MKFLVANTAKYILNFSFLLMKSYLIVDTHFTARYMTLCVFVCKFLYVYECSFVCVCGGEMDICTRKFLIFPWSEASSHQSPVAPLSPSL